MRFYLIVPLIFYLHSAFSQSGGRGVYEFLNLPAPARLASLGGKMLSVQDGDLGMVFYNPSLLDQSMQQDLVLNFVNYFAGVKYGQVVYMPAPTRLGNIAGGLHFIHYGKFIESDETGAITGQFRASEYALNLSWARDIDSSFRAGINLKPVFSVFERYTSAGIAADFGFSYHDRENLFSASLVARNLGFQFSSYHENSREPLDFEIQAALSQKLRYAPFRIFFLLHHLEHWNLLYEDPEDGSATDPFTNSPAEKNRLEQFAENFLRHTIVGVEFSPIDPFQVRIGYNYQRRKELQVNSRVAMVGFSWGFGLNLKKFSLSYGRASYHLAGASNHFSLSANLPDFYRRSLP